MYALAIIRYRRPLDEVVAHQDAHRAWLRELHAAGTVVAAGPLDPRTGGALLLRVADGDEGHRALDRIRDADPYTAAGVAQYELLPWNVGTGREGLDGISESVVRSA